MRDATTYFKGSYASNLGATLKTLIKAQALTSPGSGKYSLMAGKIAELKGKLA